MYFLPAAKLTSDAVPCSMLISPDPGIRPYSSCSTTQPRPSSAQDAVEESLLSFHFRF
ncbi:hypothetical protein B0T16DRAFT_81438 [Cercophora newfieldiana]|uniref:Uncharacterized protein n=1 Tax=Cercophora newfieldiana TaxID=92897 RepID=A0AA40CW98_9PEZI|nr:hypothetical protein B0T16DRAFT_81438 [Cercophora newfieldiana]